MEISLPHGPGGCILSNCNAWSPDGQWIAFDGRSDAAGFHFDSTRIAMVHTETGEIRTLYESNNGACCGVVLWHPREMKVAFILGPEHPTPDWDYSASRRQGVIVEVANPGVAINLDARDMTPPFTPGALRGGSHVHVFSPDGSRVSFTYEDEHLRGPGEPSLRNVAVGIPGLVTVSRGHPRNHDGTFYCKVVTQTVRHPRPGSDEIGRAFDEAWIGPRPALAFQGNVVTNAGATISEVFIVDGIDGTPSQRRLTFTEDRKYPGLQGPRHWLRSSPDGNRIGCLMKDDGGIVQFWTVSPDGGEPKQLTNARLGIGSAFTWSPCGTWIAAVVDNCIAKIDSAMGAITTLSPPSTWEDGILPEACVISPNGKQIAYVRRKNFNRICIIAAE